MEVNNGDSTLGRIQEQKKELLRRDLLRPLDLDDLEKRVMSVGIQNGKSKIKIEQSEFISLLFGAIKILSTQKSLLRLRGSWTISSGTLGNYTSLRTVFQKCGSLPETSYLFLGNYTGQCQMGIECLICLLVYKLKYPSNFFLLKGLQETISTAKSSVFYQEVMKYFGSQRLWAKVLQLFCCLPFAAVIEDSVLAVHAGIDSCMTRIDQINSIVKPFDVCEGMPGDLLGWSALEQGKALGSNRNDSLSDRESLTLFMQSNGLELICSGHQVIAGGFEFSHKQKVVKICSYSKSFGSFCNGSAVLVVNREGQVYCQQLTQENSVQVSNSE